MNEKNAREEYADIIDLPYRKSEKRRHMSLYNRAAQFAPFAALTGYDEMVREQARLTDSEHELSEYELELLDRTTAEICERLRQGEVPEIEVTYFCPDKLKAGGSYQTITGKVKAVDRSLRKLILYGSDNIYDKKTDPVIIDIGRIAMCKIIIGNMV